MTTHTSPIEVRSDQPPLPNQTFSPWLRGQTTLFISQISAILGFVLFLASLVYYVSYLDKGYKFLEPSNVQLVVDYAHIIFLAVFIAVLIQVLDDNERGSYRVQLVHKQVFGEYDGNFDDDLEASKDQLKKFKHLFLWFWIGMLLLYVCFACQHSYKLATAEQHAEPTRKQEISFSASIKNDIKQEQFSVSGSFGRTEEEKSGTPPPPAAKDLKHWTAVAKHLAFPFIVFSLNNLTLLFVFLCFLVLCIPSQEKETYRKRRNRSILVVGLLTLLFIVFVPFKVGVYEESQWNAYSSIFDALSGVMNAIALALLIARLDSKLVGLPSWLISILYSYSAVQPLFMVFELSQSTVLKQISTSVLIFVFVSKVYFFLIILYAMQTGKMLNYLFCFPILRKGAEAAQTAYDRDLTRTQTEVPEGWVGRLLARCHKVLRKLLGDEHLKSAHEHISGWLKGKDPLKKNNQLPLKISKYLGPITIGGFFVYLIIASQMLDSTGGLLSDAFVRGINVVQLLFILLAIGTLYLLLAVKPHDDVPSLTMAASIFKGSSKPRYPIENIEKQAQKFKRYFFYFWCAMFLLYVVFLLDSLDVRFCLKQHGSGFFITSKLWELPACRPTPLPDSIVLMLEILPYSFLEFALGTFNSVFIFWCFVILRSPAVDEHVETREKVSARQRVWINYAGFVGVLLVVSYPLLLFMIGVKKPLVANQMKDYATVFNGVTGTLSAVVLALLIARMDSKLFGLSSWLIGLLFGYASIQPLVVAFALNVPVLEKVRTAVIAAAFGLKICFFLIITHSLESGRVLNYLICFPFLKDRVDSIFENQFEIRLVPSGDEAKPFTILVLKKNELRYSTPKRFKSRAGCDRFVHSLRKRMEGDYLKPKNESGTHWVELRATRNGSGELICESLPLRSKEEAQELIQESRHKVPHCKYNRA